MSMYKIIQCSDNYSKTSGSVWQYYKDEPASTGTGPIDNICACKFEEKILSNWQQWHKRCCEVMTPLKCLSNFWRTLEMLPINCEINLILTWFGNCFMIPEKIRCQHLQ